MITRNFIYQKGMRTCLIVEPPLRWVNEGEVLERQVVWGPQPHLHHLKMLTSYSLSLVLKRQSFKDISQNKVITIGQSHEK